MVTTRNGYERTTKAPKRSRSDMAVILRNTPPGFNWGWFAREDPRMHLQTVDERHQGKQAHKVWLEKNGRRIIEPAGKIPAKVLKTLEADLTPDRLHVEVPWTNFMIKNDWLQLAVVGPIITLIVYPGTPNRFTRTIDLHDYLVERYIARLKSEDVDLNGELAALEIWPQAHESNRYHIRLPPILWQG